MTEVTGPRPPVAAGLDILRPIGRGHAATVWLARQRSLDRVCAVKQIPGAPPDDPRGLMQEARLLAALAHPNIVAVYDVVATSSEVLVVMEYLDAGTLADWMRLGGPSWDEALRIVDEVAGATAAATSIGVVHRDLKPANILLDSRGGCHVGDFGVAALQRAPAAGGGYRVVGTPAYMSPEQARGADATAASDVYSLGVIAYRLLCGRLPFGGDDAYAVMRDQVSTPPPRPRAVCPDIPAAAERELLRSLDKRPAHRRPALVFASSLRNAMERGTSSDARATMPPQSGPPPLMSRVQPQHAAEVSTTAITSADATITDDTAHADTAPHSLGDEQRTRIGAVLPGSRSRFGLARRHYPWRRILLVVAIVVLASVGWRLFHGGSSGGACSSASVTLDVTRASQTQSASITVQYTCP